MKHPRKTNRLALRLLSTALTLALLIPLCAAGVSAEGAGVCYPACAASYSSLVDALGSVGADASFTSRKAIAVANGVSGYTGTAAQNIRLLNLLKDSALRRPELPDPPLTANLGRVNYIAQDSRTCKATAVAMAVNVLRGSDECSTAGMGGTNCASIEGTSYTGSDGRTYTGTYLSDGYTGSADELTGAVDAALSAGIPIVAAVHSTAGGTAHHWVLVVGKSGNDYLIADPAWGSSGTVSANVSTLAARRYAFGLTDYSTPHYGYVTFNRK